MYQKLEVKLSTTVSILDMLRMKDELGARCFTPIILSVQEVEIKRSLV
jgi:hypothetical protein